MRKIFVAKHISQKSDIEFVEGLSLQNAVISKVITVPEVTRDAYLHLFTKFVESGASHFLWIGANKGLSVVDIEQGLDLIDADAMIDGFQYSWDTASVPQLIPFLAQDLFCVTRRFVIDFAMVDNQNDHFSGEQKLLEASFRANRAGLRFVGLPSIPYVISGAFFEKRSDLKHFNAIIENYLNSQDRAWNKFASRFRFDENVPLRILFDLNHLSASHNGALICSAHTLRGIYKNGVSGEVSICSSNEVRDFISIEKEFPNWRWLESTEVTAHTFDIVFDFGQPWFFERISFFNKNCFSVFFLFHDVIAWDCLYIRQVFPDLDRLWKYWIKFASGLVYVSQHSRDLIEKRFPDAKNTPGLTALSSTHYEDYKRFYQETKIEQEATSVLPVDLKYYLIFGNFFHHKYIQETIDTILPLLEKDQHLVIIGAYTGTADGQIIHLNSGYYSHEQISRIYRGALAVFYPSYYEGFGLPSLEALAHEKVVVARDTPLLNEIIEHWDGPGEVISYGDNLDLKEKFNLLRQDKHQFVAKKGRAKARNDWSAVGAKELEFLIKTHRTKENKERVENRFREYDLMQAVLDKQNSNATNPFRLFGDLVDRKPRTT